MTHFDATQPAAPSDTDRRLAGESARRLAPSLAKAAGAMTLTVTEPGGDRETVTVPASAVRLLVTILGEMANGNAVRVVPHHAALTTQEAAALLNVSRPYVVRLLEDGRLPFHRVGTHRRVLFKDVIAYQAKHHRARRKALDDLSKLDQELGLS